MKDITKFNDEFEKIIKESKQEEAAWYAKERELYKAYGELEKRNLDRVERIKVIRKQKLEDINKLINELSELNEKLCEAEQEILKSYCEKNGHNYIVTGYTYLGSTGHCYGEGEIFYIKKNSKCSVCENETWIKYETTKLPKMGFYEKTVPDDIFTDNLLIYDGKTYEEINNELKCNNSYIEYLQFLKSCICVLFGHKIPNNINIHAPFPCEYCGLVTTSYEIEHKPPKYKGVEPNWDYEKKMIINKPDEDLILSLPTYEEFLSIKKEKSSQKEAKTLVKKDKK